MFKHDRIKNKRCSRCIEIGSNRCYGNERYVKTSPRTCLSNEEYMSCHILCKPCWKQNWCENYDIDKKKQMNYKHCCLCRMKLILF